MYQDYFNFNTAPFSIAPDPHFIYMSQHHQEGLAHLLYGINQGGGFVALTGEVGTGKTTLCHCLLEQLPDNVDIALILNPKLNAIELLANICDELNIVYDSHRLALKHLVDSLNHYLLESHAQGRRTVLMIDEAQNLSLDVLEQIRLLTNLETSKTKLLQIILIGQPELKLILEKPELRQLNQRITARYHLTPLSSRETQDYIKHRLAISGARLNIFDKRAMAKIYTLSQGIPRLINILSDRALLGAYVTDKQTVTSKIVGKAAKEVFTRTKSSGSYYQKWVLGSLLFMSIILWQSKQYFIFEQPKKKHIILSGSFKKPVKNLSLPSLVVQPEAKVKADKLVFKTRLFNRDTTLDSEISHLASLWENNIDADSNCPALAKQNLHCLLDKSSWKDLIALNRPVILEFSTLKGEKFYALLLGLEQGNPVFKFDTQLTVPLQEVLAIWDGYYLMLWQSPVEKTTLVYPNKKSKAVEWIRKQFPSLKKDLSKRQDILLFDDELKQAVMTFQKRHQLTTDGIVGPRTFIHLNNFDPNNSAPKLTVLP